MSDSEASPYKNKVFDERILQFCLGIVELSDFSNANPAILRKAMLDSLGLCSSLDELTEYWSKLSLSLSTVKVSGRETKSAFDLNLVLGTLSTLGKAQPARLHDFLFTINRLAATKDFIWWEDFLSVVNTLARRESQLAEFLNSTRFLCDSHLFSDWEVFFSATKSLDQLFASDQVLEYFTTIRYLAPTKFPGWSAFFTACKKLSTTNQEPGAFFEAIRHSRHYFVTEESFRGILRALSETPEFSGAFAFGQLDSKKWLLEEADKVWGSKWGSTVFVLAGWVGLLPRMMYDQKIKVLKVRSFDVDASANRASESINQTEVQQDWAYKSSTQDITQMRYPATYNVLRKDGSACELCDMPDVVINTSCEHIADINSWWQQIPMGTKVILQSNNGFHIPEHVACFKNLSDFTQAMKLSQVHYSGEKDLPEFKRFMLIGVK